LLRAQFGDYRAHEGVFTASSPAWEVRDNAVQFWTEIKPFAPELGEFALRLLHTPANSVPSERSFSTRNLIQDLKRNALDPAVADKVSYIHVNQRVLDRKGTDARTWFHLDKEALVDYEDKLLAGHPEFPDWLEASNR
jgi:hypothetical protein